MLNILNNYMVNFLLSGFGFWYPRVYKFVLPIVPFNLYGSFIRVYFFIRRHQLKIHIQQQAVQSSDAENKLNVTRLKRSAMNTFVLFIVLIICHLPLYVLLHITQEFYSIKLICTNLYALFSHVRKAYTAN